MKPGSAIPGSAAPQRGIDHPHAYGWHSRGYLPHFDAPDAIQHITYRLADSLPIEVLAKFDKEMRVHTDDQRDVERRRRIEAFLDAGHGSCVLKHPDAARCVVETWLRFDVERYRLLAFVVMPNHCHVLIERIDGFPLWKIVNSWKSYTARWINGHILGGVGLQAALGRGGPSDRAALEHDGPITRAALGRGGPRGAPRQLWQREYWDRYIRDERHFQSARAYIENNPVSAGLVKIPTGWPWSSAGCGFRMVASF